MFHVVLPSGEWLIYWPSLPDLYLYTLPFDAINKGITSSYIGFIFGTVKLIYNQVKVAWWSTQSFGHKHQRDRHTDSHVARANAAPTHCVLRQKWKLNSNAILREQHNIPTFFKIAERWLSLVCHVKWSKPSYGTIFFLAKCNQGYHCE